MLNQVNLMLGLFPVYNANKLNGENQISKNEGTTEKEEFKNNKTTSSLTQNGYLKG